MKNEKQLKMPQQNDLASFALSSDCCQYAYDVEEAILVLGETEHGQKMVRLPIRCDRKVGHIKLGESETGMVKITSWHKWHDLYYHLQENKLFAVLESLQNEYKLAYQFSPLQNIKDSEVFPCPIIVKYLKQVPPISRDQWQRIRYPRWKDIGTTRGFIGNSLLTGPRTRKPVLHI